jgi:hypothetical protein
MQTLARGVVRYFFHFVLFYWICFTFPFPIDLVGLPLQLIETANQPAWMADAGAKYGATYEWLISVKDNACTWVGERVLHVEVIKQLTGSGDTMRAYVGCVCAVVIAAATALMWTAVVLLVQRRKPDWHPDRRLHGLLRVMVRFFLCQMLLGYGFAKVFPLQFAQPSSFRLAQQLGDMSPMGLLWTFMGFSPAYQIFTGAVEVLAGLSLTTRRTTLLGSLIALAAMTNVFLMNMCFDVPVKLYSLHYLLMAIFLIAPDLPRLIRVLVLGKAVEARPYTPLFGNVILDRVVLSLRTLLVVAIVYGQIRGNYERWIDMYGGPPAPVVGRWDLVSMEVDKKEPGKDDPMTWNWLDFSSRKYMRLAGPKPPHVMYSTTWDKTEKKLTLSRFTKPDWSATFTYELPEPEKLELQGQMDGKAISASLKRAPEKTYELMNRGFHWIQELPFNR